MAVDVTLLTSSSLNNITTNFQRVETALQDAVSRSGGLPNEMNADFDMNSNNILNVNQLDAEVLLIDGEPVVPGSLVTIPNNSVGTNQLIDLSVTRPKLAQVMSNAIPRDLGEFGAVGDGVADDSAAITAWLASSPYLTVGPGTYLNTKRTIPTSVKHIQGRGGVVFKNMASTFTSGVFKNAWTNGTAYVAGDMVQFLLTFETIGLGLTTTGLMYRAKIGNTGTPPSNNPVGADNTQWEFVAFDSFWTFSGNTDLIIRDVGFSVESVTYPQVRTLNFSGCSRVRTQNLYLPQGGGYAIYNGNCVDVVHDSASIYNYAYIGMFGEGASQKFIKFVNCHVETTGTHLGGVGTAHGIVFSLGTDCQAVNCTSKNAGVFGFSVNETDRFVLDGISIDSAQEGFNTISGKNGFIRGIAKWVLRLSIDFGVSIDGTTGSGVSNVHSNVIVEQSGVSAFVFTGTVVDCTAIVIAKNCNQTNTADEAGILFSGANCQRNTGYITMVDEYSPHRMRYGIAEINKGNGDPSNNTLHVNTVAGFLTAEVRRAGPTSKIFGHTIQTFTPVISAASGTITTSSGNIKWKYDGEDIVYTSDVTITTNGTGAGGVHATVPIPAVAEGGSGAGKEVIVSGKQVSVEISTTNLIFRFYDNTYPGANTARIVATGRYRPSA